MGTHLLQRYDYGDFLEFLSRNGFVDEFDFWSSLSGISAGSVTDHLKDYLQSLGYSGSPTDMVREFLQDQVGYQGSIYDDATVFYEGTYPPVGGTQIVDDEGVGVVDDDGTAVVDGS